MKVAILGAGSSLGVRIVESFQLGEGPSLTAIAREASHLAAAARFPIDLRVGDLLDVETLARCFAGCSAAVHTLEVDLSDLVHSVLAFCRAGALARVRRMIYVSSADVYGVDPPAGTDEKTPLRPHHASERVNILVAADSRFSSECRRLGLAGIVLRPGLVYGPRCSWLASIVTDLWLDRAWLAHQGGGICNAVYVDRVVSAIRLALKTKAVAGPAFLLTDDHTFTWRHLYEAIALEFGWPDRIHYREANPRPATPDPDDSPRRNLTAETSARHRCMWKLPATRAVQRLKLEPDVPFAEGIRRSADWWRFAHGEFAP